MRLVDFNNPRILIVWAAGANSAYRQIVPELSQVSVKDGAASFETGFPPLNFVPKVLGGVGPFGYDMNGLFEQVTTDLQWIQAGGAYLFNYPFAAQVGGYPHKAMIQSADVDAKLWFSLVDNNPNNPDVNPTNWRSLSTPPNADLLGGINHGYVQVTVGNGLLITGAPTDPARTLNWDPPTPVVGFNQTFFTVPGTYAVTIRAKACKAVLIGGGGGSGTGGGGGGAGANIFLWLSGLTPGRTMTLTVGNGGFGGVSPQPGGDTSLGSGTESIPFYLAGGGHIGTGGNGGSGGTFTVGDQNAFASIGNGGGGAGPGSGGGLVTIFGPTFGSGGGATGQGSPLDAYGGICVIDWIN